MCAEKYGIVPKMGRIRIANEQFSEIQTFTVEDHEMKVYLKQFIDLTEQFRNLYMS